MSNMSHQIYQVLNQLESAKIHDSLSRVRDDCVMIEAHVPSRHYEIEVFMDSHMEVEIYKSSGGIHGIDAFEELLRNSSD